MPRSTRGVTFLDNAWEYHEHESEIRMGARDRGPARARVPDDARSARTGATRRWRCGSSRSRCRRLKTDHLDLWQVHECAYYNDPDRHFARGGVVEALDRAKQEGKVRFVGFTGHK